MLAQLDVQ